MSREAAHNIYNRGSALDAVADEILDGIRDRGTYRRMRVLDGLQAPRMTVDGRDVMLFAGSNYLDLARHPEVIEAAERASREYGCAAGGSMGGGAAYCCCGWMQAQPDWAPKSGWPLTWPRKGIP